MNSRNGMLWFVYIPCTKYEDYDHNYALGWHNKLAPALYASRGHIDLSLFRFSFQPCWLHDRHPRKPGFESTEHSMPLTSKLLVCESERERGGGGDMIGSIPMVYCCGVEWRACRQLLFFVKTRWNMNYSIIEARLGISRLVKYRTEFVDLYLYVLGHDRNTVCWRWSFQFF